MQTDRSRASAAAGELTQLPPAATDMISAPWVDLGRDTPFIFLRRAADGWTLHGQAQGAVGHRLPGAERSSAHGMFGQWAWDGHCLTAQTDPLAFFSLYVYEKDGDVAISPCVLQLIAQGADPAPDPVAAAVFHRLGFFVGDDTPFRHIRTLPPNGRLTWRDGRLAITGGHTPPRHDSISERAAIEAIVEVPRAEIRQALAVCEGSITLPLSGGRDSRHILLELLRQGRKPDACVTFHPDGAHLNAEARSARALADHVGVHHLLLGHRRPRLRDTLRALLMSQLCTDEHRQMVALHDYMSLARRHLTFDGIAGDVLLKSEGAIRHDPDGAPIDLRTLRTEADFARLARSTMATYARVTSRPGHQGGAGALYSSEHEAAAIERVTRALMAMRDYPHPYRAFMFWNRTRREISFVSTAILGNAAMTLAPYLAPELVELGLSLPVPANFRNLHDEAIRAAYPDAAGIPYADDLTVPPAPRMPVAKLFNGIDNLRTAAMAGPGPAPVSILRTLRRSPLARAQADIIRLHRDLTGAMSAAEARRLLDLERDLYQTAPKGMATVRDSFPGH